VSRELSLLSTGIAFFRGEVDHSQVEASMFATPTTHFTDVGLLRVVGSEAVADAYRAYVEASAAAFERGIAHWPAFEHGVPLSDSELNAMIALREKAKDAGDYFVELARDDLQGVAVELAPWRR
jgi:hypothetical protein